MKFSQGRDDVAQEKETVLKKLFLNSMKNTERRLIQIGNQNTINRMSQYISQVTKNNEEKERVEKILTKPLDKLMDRMLIVDMSVMEKAQTDAELNVIEKRQIAQIQDDVGKLENYQPPLPNTMARSCKLNSTKRSLKKLSSSPGSHSLEIPWKMLSSNTTLRRISIVVPFRCPFPSPNHSAFPET